MKITAKQDKTGRISYWDDFGDYIGWSEQDKKGLLHYSAGVHFFCIFNRLYPHSPQAEYSHKPTY